MFVYKIMRQGSIMDFFLPTSFYGHALIVKQNIHVFSLNDNGLYKNTGVFIHVCPYLLMKAISVSYQHCASLEKTQFG